MPNPRILIVTPEITYLPEGMGNMAQRMHAKAGGLADVSASLVAALFDLGADVHVALPNYRQMFHTDVFNIVARELDRMRKKLPQERIHLAEDRLFYYREQVYSNYGGENPRIALAFQREVLNRIIRAVRPNLIHCNDWMTGLIPAAARSFGIPCLFTVHNIHTEKLTLHEIESSGLDAKPFSQHFYYTNPPQGYQQDWETNQVDFLASGIFAAHYINTVSPSFLDEVTAGCHAIVPDAVRRELRNKQAAGCAVGILNAPDPSYDPAADPALRINYTAENFASGKQTAKAQLQQLLGLEQNPNAPLFFWPSRLDPVQKGPQLLTDCLYKLVSEFWQDGMQIVLVANGEYQRHFHDIVRHHDLYSRVAVANFEENLSRTAFAASDFIFMPSSFEPCGLPQMIAPLYGSLPVAHRTGGIKDTIEHLDVPNNRGNGFLFNHFDTNGFVWATRQAMDFHRLPANVKAPQIKRIMTESAQRFTHDACAKEYFRIYEDMLKRPLIN